MRADGRHRERLTKGRDDDSDPAYSPDSRRIAFSRDGTLFLMNADGRHQRRLAHQPGGLYRPSVRARRQVPLADGAGTGLYSVRVGDGRVKRLTDGQRLLAGLRPMGDGSCSAATATRSCTRSST